MSQATYRRPDVRWIHLGQPASGVRAGSVENWTGLLESTTSRSYKSDFRPGSPTARVCHGDYRATLTFQLEPTGKISGTGRVEATNVKGCEISYPVRPPLRSGDLTVTGSADAESLLLMLASATPMTDADYAAYTTLFLTVPYCQTFNRREIRIPRSGADAASGVIELNEKFTCAGSADDDLRARHAFRLDRVK
jgi:hypothetical protein